jgi:hypothetical protein
MGTMPIAECQQMQQAFAICSHKGLLAPQLAPKNEVGKLFGEVPFQFFMLTNASTKSISTPQNCKQTPLF